MRNFRKILQELNALFKKHQKLQIYFMYKFKKFIQNIDIAK